MRFRTLLRLVVVRGFFLCLVNSPARKLGEFRLAPPEKVVFISQINSIPTVSKFGLALRGGSILLFLAILLPSLTLFGEREELCGKDLWI